MKQVTAILIGAGQRGAEAYASYALNFPTEFKIIGVAEPRVERREKCCQLHNISDENATSSWEALLSRPRMADCVLVCTQDQMHFQVVKAALEKGYHVLCEKPMSTDKQEIIQMGKLAKQYGRILSICHVLRYSPFFTQLKELLDKGTIGELISIQHIESVGFWHMAHSYVRGNWRNSDETSPMILAKCCHDIDILLWLVGSSCTKVSSFGGLLHFNSFNAPEGATDRCTDGCPSRDGCPYYAPRFYLEHPRAVTDNFVNVVTLESSRQEILEALKRGPYGRCVYKCDNNVVDHQVVNMEYANGVTASITMCAFTSKCERIINMMGSKGQIKGNMEENLIEVIDFVTGHTSTIKLQTSSTGHSGSDVAMMHNFVELVAKEDILDTKSSADKSVESHLIALAAEESRLQGGMPVTIEEGY